MRRLLLSGIDLLAVCLATCAALLVRDDLIVSITKVMGFLPYLAITAGVAAVTLPAFGVSKRLWRYTNLADCLRICRASIAIVAGALACGSIEGVLGVFGRSVPILQGLFICAAIIGLRIASRTRYFLSADERNSAQVFSVDRDQLESIVVVGLGRFAEVYLRASSDTAALDRRIVGVIGGSELHVGRVMLGYPVLGTPDQIESVVEDLAVHGINVDRVVLTTRSDELPVDFERRIARLARDLGLTIERFGDQFASALHGAVRCTRSTPAVQPGLSGAAFVLGPTDLSGLRRRSYWHLKRAIDIVAAVLLLLLLSPVILIVGAVIAVGLGRPVLFWQMRPGLGGRQFRMHKFRTMASSCDQVGRRRSDTERVTWIGHCLRRVRLDELPQLFNILKGDMSFVGPRPLLQAEQLQGYAARLLVRPGLTGWAQVKGGRNISFEDKSALDIWYACHASMALDFEIFLRTIPLLIFGDRVNGQAIVAAWHDLEIAGICRSQGQLTRHQK